MKDKMIMISHPEFIPLKKGDCVEVTAPSYGVTEDIMKNICHFIESWGLKVHLQPNWKMGNHPLYAHGDEERFDSLKAALLSPQAKAIWVPRGGAGGTKLIPKLMDWAHRIPEAPAYKIFIGFSDLTSVHTFLNYEWGWPTIHAPTLSGIVKSHCDQDSINYLQKILFGEIKEIFETKLISLNEAAGLEGTIKGPIIGGNHSVLQYSIGTPWQIECFHKILFLEDVDERPYRIDVRLDHFLQTKILEGVKAIIFGDFSYSSIDEEEEYCEKIDYVLKSFAEKLSIPVLRMPGYGHSQRNKPLIMGMPTFLHTGQNPSLHIPLNS